MKLNYEKIAKSMLDLPVEDAVMGCVEDPSLLTGLLQHIVELAALRAQLEAAKDLKRRWMGALTDVALRLNVALYDDRPGAFTDKVLARIAAAREDAVMEFAEWLMLRWSGNDVRQYWEEHVTNYLSSLGVHSARPDDVQTVALPFGESAEMPLRARPDDGRVERVAREMYNCCSDGGGPWDERTSAVHSVWSDAARAVLAAADGADRGGR